jgi:hypothetical protein
VVKLNTGKKLVVRNLDGDWILVPNEWVIMGGDAQTEWLEANGAPADETCELYFKDVSEVA